jgi:hypothetical protein
MEKGNEGDEIILLSLRQIDCVIPPDVVKVGQISADLLVEIIVKALFLISNGEIQVSCFSHNTFFFFFLFFFLMFKPNSFCFSFPLRSPKTLLLAIAFAHPLPPK